jgi:hypothetical protein
MVQSPYHTYFTKWHQAVLSSIKILKPYCGIYHFSSYQEVPFQITSEKKLKNLEGFFQMLVWENSHRHAGSSKGEVPT